jgi:small redox-active disulfide protein 2
MEIKVLGTGCPKCKSLEKLTQEAVAELGIKASVTKEEDIMKIMAYGILSTPGLVIDDKVVMSGRLPSKNEIINLLNQ